MSLFDRLDELERQIAEAHRKMDTLIRAGTVKSNKDGKYVVDVGFATHELDHLQHGGKGKDHRPLKDGQQVTLLCPGGDVANAAIIPGGYHDANAAPSTSQDEDIVGERGGARLRTQDGVALLEALSTILRVDGGAITMTVGDVVFEFTGGGFAQTGGGQTHDGHDVGKTHVHTLVTPGPGDTGPPP